MKRRTRELRGGHLTAGFGLVELLLASALGLVLVAGLLGLTVDHLAQQKAVMSRTRLSQDLRAGMDLALRDVRRSGWWGQAEQGVWQGEAGTAGRSPYGGVLPEFDPLSGQGSGSTLGHRYSRDTVENHRADLNEHFGLRAHEESLEWRTSGPALEPGPGDRWQDLTDPALTRVTALEVTHHAVRIDLLAECGLSECPDAADPSCPPQLLIHRVELSVRGQDRRQAEVSRTLMGAVRLRNEEVLGDCPPP